MFSTREEWLNAFVQEARPQFEEAGAPIPTNVRVSIGFTSKGARSKRIGECWSDNCSADGTFEIFIVPGTESESRIADILTHELIHAAVGLEAGHKAPFKRVAVALGLEGKMTATTAGDLWHAWADPVLMKLGKMPHAALTGGGVSTAPKKQTTRMLKCECDCCGFTFRASNQWASVESLRCPDPACDGQVMVAS